ncbi:MAG: energy transducer TonB [Proteobacteria bacterium]|nr:energy transducer TonB [Pseudomonadota bacterium]
MEYISIDLGMIQATEMSGEAKIRDKGKGSRVKGEKTSAKAEGVKTESAEVHSVDNPGGNKPFSINNTIDEKDKDKKGMQTETVSLNAFSSLTGSGAHKGGKTGTGAIDSAEGTDGGSSGLPGQGGGGKAYDYGYVREAVMKNLKYPEKARRFGWEGKVILSFIINESGSVRDVKIVKSSGIQMLDEAAKDALTRVTAFQNKYNRLMVVQLPIEFRLKQ